MKSRGYSVPKTAEVPNEDRWQVSHAGDVCVVSDGASVSFDSGTWAEILVRSFVGAPTPGDEWLAAAVSEFSGLHDRENMEWMQQASFDRGSFATLIAIVRREGETRTFAVGDSLFAAVRGAELLWSYPYTSPEEFDAAPTLLSTNTAENRRAFADGWEAHWRSVGDTCTHYLLMTDALGRWLLDDPSADRVRALANASAETFDEFVGEERAAGRLRMDDSTLVVCEVV